MFSRFREFGLFVRLHFNRTIYRAYTQQVRPLLLLLLIMMSARDELALTTVLLDSTRR